MERILHKQSKQRYTLGVVYEPNVVDSQGDYTDSAELEKAAWQFMRHLQGRPKMTKLALQTLQAIQKAATSGVVTELDVTELLDTVQKAGSLGDMHEAWDESFGDIVESYIAPCEMTLNGERVQKGTWLMGVVWSESYFQKIESGERIGYSMGGTARVIPGR